MTRCLALLAVGIFFVSCDSPRDRALRELGKSGIDPSGRSLTDAVLRDDSFAISRLLAAGVHTEHQDPTGRTPLRIAVDDKKITLAARLIASKANVNASTRDGRTVLSVAVEQGQSAMVERLLEARARVDGTMSDGEKVLPWAIREGRLLFVRAMMKSNDDPHVRDREGNPLLHVAMKYGRRDVMESLLELGANPRIPNAAGEGTIELAIRQGWYDLIPSLTRGGANPDLPCFSGSTPLQHALATHDIPLVKALLDSGVEGGKPSFNGGLSPLETAFESGNAELLEVFFAKGHAPPGGDWNAWLWKAFDQRRDDIARLMCKHGARPLTRDAGGALMIEAATLERQGNFVKLLLDYGCSPGLSMHHAAARGDREMIDLLATCGASINGFVPPFDDTPLIAAVRSRHDLAALQLLKSGAHYSTPPPEGQPLFLLAVATGCHRTVKHLLGLGADPNMAFHTPVSPVFLRTVRRGIIRSMLKNDSNVTPLMVAADSGVVETAALLLRAGAKTDVHTKRSHFWPLNFASQRNDVQMMRLILGKDPVKEKRLIVIRLSEQKARLYDAAGTELFATPVSTGKRGYTTPTGRFVITNKHRDWTSTLYRAKMPFFQRLSCSDFGLHQGSVPGYPASHGCIRVPAGNASKLFAMTEAGDRVEIIP